MTTIPEGRFHDFTLDEAIAIGTRNDPGEKVPSVSRTLIKALADCFRISGADPDGNEDWRIAGRAVRAVSDLRRDYDENEDWKLRAEQAESEVERLQQANAGLRDALESIRQYGADTLSGRADGGPNDREWQRAAVLEMTRRARIAAAAEAK